MRRRPAVPHRGRRRHLQPRHVPALPGRPSLARGLRGAVHAPADRRYGENPYQLGHYYQYQVVIKPSPADIQDVYLRSLEALGIDLAEHDVRFVEDNWEAPRWAPGARVGGLGRRYGGHPVHVLQQLDDYDLDPITIEITYGLERLAMYLQGVDSVYDLVWSRWDEDGAEHVVTYGDVYQENEREFSRYSFEVADTEMLYRHFREHEAEALRTVEARLPIHGPDQVLKCSHAFNMLDARGVIRSPTAPPTSPACATSRARSPASTSRSSATGASEKAPTPARPRPRRQAHEARVEIG